MSSRPPLKTYGKPRPTSTPHDEPSSSFSLLLSSSPAVPSSDLVTPPSSPSKPSYRRITSGVTHDYHDVTEDEDASTGELIIALSSHMIKRTPCETTEIARADKSKRSSKQGSLKGFFAPLPKRAKQPLRPTATVAIPSTSPKYASKLDPAASPTQRRAFKKSTKSLTQLHLTHLPLLHSCPECQMSFVRGGEDEGLHMRHHARVVRGISWEGLGRMKGKEGEMGTEAGFRVVMEGLDEVLSTVDLVLSAPSLPPAILDRCKIFLLLTSSPPPLTSAKRPRLLDAKTDNGNGKERIIGIVVAQNIKWAMRVLRDEDGDQGFDSGGGVMCDPKPLPTSLGIHRLLVLPAYRSLGLARLMLDVAAQHTVYGCRFDPHKGEVAFSQPTNSGRRVMDSWGGGNVRVFVDDESQI